MCVTQVPCVVYFHCCTFKKMPGSLLSLAFQHAVCVPFKYNTLPLHKLRYVLYLEYFNNACSFTTTAHTSKWWFVECGSWCRIIVGEMSKIRQQLGQGYMYECGVLKKQVR